MVPIVTLESLVVMSRNMITSLLPFVEKLSTKAATPSSASSLRFNIFGDGLCVWTILAAVRISVVRLEECFGMKYDVAIRARILHLLFMITLFVDFPVILPCEAFVA